MNAINTVNFKRDEREAHRVELELLQIVKKKYPRARKMQGNFPWYDIEVPEAYQYIEVKYDKKSEFTGNFFIETSFNGELSGIELSESTYYVFADRDNFYWIATDALKWVVRDFREITLRGEDGTIVTGKLINRDYLICFQIAMVVKRHIFAT